MKLDQKIHRKKMLEILASISQNPLLANNLGFKGGTACYFLHGLDRFSVDLDFDLINKQKEQEVMAELLKLLKQFGKIKTKTSIKLIYDPQYQALKIDVSKRYNRNKDNTYEIVSIIPGINLKVLQKKDIFAHKLLAITLRSKENSGKTPFIANRDLYDIAFFFQHNWQYNPIIIENQTNMTVKKYLQQVYDYIEKYVNSRTILDRLGELLTPSRRTWVKKHLKNYVLTQLQIEISSLQLQN